MKDKKYIAFKCLNNWGGIGIHEIKEDSEKITFSYYYGENKRSRIATAKIRSNLKGYLYFISFNKRYYVDDFLRTDL